MNAVTATLAPSTAPTHIDCINPATGEALGQVLALNPQQVQDAVERARIAQKVWGASSFKQRRAVLNRLLDLILQNRDAICAAVVEDSGKTWENALLGEVMPVCSKIRWLLRYGEKHLRTEIVGSGLLVHKKARIEYRPLGVVACIVPWNYPFQNIYGSFIAPLIAGNTVVIKASEAVAWSTRYFQTLIDQALQAEGFSTDTVQIINGYGATGAALVRARVQKILFIGSVRNGRRIIEGSAEHLTPAVMELGGKDPMIVCEDANLEHAAHSALGGCFINLGQNCIASERIIVLDGIYERFVSAVQPLAAALRLGVPNGPGSHDVGAINTVQQIALIDELVRDALASGARALVGGEIVSDAPGNFYPPTVLVDVTPDMRIAKEEVFGPVMLIMRVQNDEQAIAVANGTNFGLQSSVLTRNRKRGERIAAQLDAGATCINDFGLCYLNQNLPFGGVKYSGYGRMNGRDGLRAYTNPKAVLSDRWPFQFPPRLYPVGPKDYATASHTIQLLFARRWRDKLSALFSLLRVQFSGARA